MADSFHNQNAKPLTTIIIHHHHPHLLHHKLLDLQPPHFSVLPLLVNQLGSYTLGLTHFVFFSVSGFWWACEKSSITAQVLFQFKVKNNPNAIKCSCSNMFYQGCCGRNVFCSGSVVPCPCRLYFEPALSM